MCEIAAIRSIGTFAARRAVRFEAAEVGSFDLTQPV
jgi:hypothetical protein